MNQRNIRMGPSFAKLFFAVLDDIFAIIRRLRSCNMSKKSSQRLQLVAYPWGGAAPPLHKRARKIFLNTSENKSRDRKLSLILFVSSAYRIAITKVRMA